MDQENTNPLSAGAELYQPNPFLEGENSRRGLQGHAWKHAVVVAVSIALILLVVKCTMQLASYKATSVRMLAVRFPPPAASRAASCPAACKAI